MGGDGQFMGWGTDKSFVIDLCDGWGGRTNINYIPHTIVKTIFDIGGGGEIH